MQNRSLCRRRRFRFFAAWSSPPCAKIGKTVPHNASINNIKNAVAKLPNFNLLMPFAFIQILNLYQIFGQTENFLILQ